MRIKGKLSGMIALLLSISLLSACTEVVTTDSTSPSVSLNGVMLENTGIIRQEDSMYVPASFITETLEGTIEEAAQDEPKDTENELDESVYFSNKVAVLMYHAIMDEPTDASIISAAQFEEHMNWLDEEGFVPISMEQYYDFLHDNGTVPDNAVFITFDDGYENFYTYAYPALKAHSFPAVNFVIVSTIDDRTAPGIKKLSWDQMREMKEHNIAFHNHTYNMHDYGVINEEGTKLPLAVGQLYLEDEKRSESDDEYIARVTEDLSKAEQRLQEELGNTISAIAFPYGAYNEQLLQVLEELNITTSFTVKPGINTSDDKNGYRINGGRSDQSVQQLLSALKETTTPITEQTRLLNGNLVTFSNIITSDKGEQELYPLREVVNELGIFIGWDSSTKTVTLVK